MNKPDSNGSDATSGAPTDPAALWNRLPLDVRERYRSLPPERLAHVVAALENMATTVDMAERGAFGENEDD